MEKVYKPKKPERNAKKVFASELKLYGYVPKSYYKTRYDTNAKTIFIDNYKIDAEGRGIFYKLDECIKHLSENKVYGKNLDEIVVFEFTVDNTIIHNYVAQFLGASAQRHGGEYPTIIILKEIDFKKLISIA